MAFAISEEWAAAYYASIEIGGFPLIRSLSAALGFSTRIGKMSGAVYNPGSAQAIQEYGGAVYSFLRQKGISTQDILDAARPCADHILGSLAPRESEVQEVENFTAQKGDPSI
jgi:hypothetical protein